VVVVGVGVVVVVVVIVVVVVALAELQLRHQDTHKAGRKWSLGETIFLNNGGTGCFDGKYNISRQQNSLQQSYTSSSFIRNCSNTCEGNTVTLTRGILR